MSLLQGILNRFKSDDTEEEKHQERVQAAKRLTQGGIWAHHSHKNLHKWVFYQRHVYKQLEPHERRPSKPHSVVNIRGCPYAIQDPSPSPVPSDTEENEENNRQFRAKLQRRLTKLCQKPKPSKHTGESLESRRNTVEYSLSSHTGNDSITQTKPQSSTIDLDQ